MLFDGATADRDFPEFASRSWARNPLPGVVPTASDDLVDVSGLTDGKRSPTIQTVMTVCMSDRQPSLFRTNKAFVQLGGSRVIGASPFDVRQDEVVAAINPTPPANPYPQRCVGPGACPKGATASAEVRARRRGSNGSRPNARRDSSGDIGNKHEAGEMPRPGNTVDGQKTKQTTGMCE
jgi:hypothetical protein